jgi:hypothetical protein
MVSGSPLRLDLSLMLCPPRVRRQDGQASTRHTQQHCRPIGIAAGRKPANVMGRAIFTLQHGFFRLGVRRQASTGCVERLPVQVFSKADDVPAGPFVAGHLLPVHDELLERYNSN